MTSSSPLRLARTLRVGLVTALLASLLSACAFGPPDEKEEGQPPRLPTPSASPSKDPTDEGIGVQVIAKNLTAPWALAFLPDGTALVTERDSRRILKVSGGGKVDAVQTIDDATSQGEGGLLGIAVSPNYDNDKYVYVYYTSAQDNRIARLRLGEKPEPIVTGIPSSRIHNGGRLKFGPDGFLYAGTGDADQSGRAQDTGNLGGKILRMTPEGKPAPGNPFGDSLVYSYGHRNVQGFDWDGEKRMYATEFGQDSWDEVNRIEAGKNYGWPTVEGKSTDNRFTPPLVVWTPAEASPSGMVITNNVLAVACLRGKRLWAMQLDGNGGVKGEPQPLLENKFGRLRDIVRAPDGSLWVLTSNKDGRGSPVGDDDRIIRILPPGESGANLV